MAVYKKHVKVVTLFLASILGFFSFAAADSAMGLQHIDVSLVNAAHADAPPPAGGDGGALPSDDGSC